MTDWLVTSGKAFGQNCSLTLQKVSESRTTYLKIGFWNKSSLSLLIFCFPPTFTDILTNNKIKSTQYWSNVNNVTKPYNAYYEKSIQLTQYRKNSAFHPHGLINEYKAVIRWLLPLANPFLLPISCTNTGEYYEIKQVWCVCSVKPVIHTWAIQEFVWWGVIQINIPLPLPFTSTKPQEFCRYGLFV